MGELCILHFFGTCLRFLLILLFRYCSGTQVYCRIWLRYATVPKRNCANYYMALLHLGGQVVRNTGNGMKLFRWYLPVLATPLVLSVHTIVSFDFATSVIPGWHTTIFPPYFVAGAIFSGFAMVQTLLLVVRKVLNLQDYITLGHIEAMNKVIVLTGSIVGCAYLTELFMGWYSMNDYEGYTFFYSRANIFSPYGWSYWGMMFCNVVSPQVFWFRKLEKKCRFYLFHECDSEHWYVVRAFCDHCHFLISRLSAK